MPVSKQLPASIRYLKARLSVLKRPSVWGSACVVLVSIVLLSEAWNHPERLAIGNNDVSADRAEPTSPPQPTALDPLSSVEEPSPNDSVDAPSNPFVQSSESDGQAELDALLLDPILTIPVPARPPASQPSLFQTPSESSGSNNGFDVGLPNLMALTGTSSLADSATNTPSGLRSGLTNSLTAPDDRTALNSDQSVLQSALDRYAISNNSQADASSQSDDRSDSFTPSNALDDTPDDSVSPVSLANSYYLPQPLPGQPSVQQTLSQPVYIPQTSPYPGTTGYTLPPVLRTPTISDSIGSGGYTNLGQPQPIVVPQYRTPLALPSTIQPATFGAGYPAPVQPGVQPTAPQPFSVPRTPPGQYIGGGQINTFANP